MADPDRFAILLHQRDEENLKNIITDMLSRGDAKAAGYIDALINCLLVQGKHREARKWMLDTAHQKRINAHQKAVEMDDGEECKCPHEPTIEALTKHEVAEKSWDGKKERIRHHFRCRHCGHTNAKIAASDIAHGLIEKGRAEAHRMFYVYGPWRPGDGRRIGDQELLEQIKNGSAR